MNKAELVSKIADDGGLSKTQSNAALDSFVDAVTKTLKKGDKVTLVGFGTWSVAKRSARTGRNPPAAISGTGGRDCDYSRHRPPSAGGK